MEPNLIWIDLEMTGLDPDRDYILEIATIVTDSHCNIIAEGPNIAINYPEEILCKMDNWSRRQHNSSGLIERIRHSSYNCHMAEEETLRFLSDYCKKGESPLCGNSVWQDRLFLRRHMPKLESFFHYRNIDVSSLKELVRRWYPSLPQYQKKKSHLALFDIKESINELLYYKKMVFIST